MNTTNPRGARCFRSVILSSGMALGLHLLFLAVLPAGLQANQSSDFVGHYEPAARALVAGQGYVDRTGAPEVRYPPGFSVLIAMAWTSGGWLGLEHDAALRVAIALWTALGGGTFHLLARSLVPRRTAWIATIGWITYLPFLWLGKQPNTETPFFIPFFLSLWCAACWACRSQEGRTTLVWPAACGALLGLATLIRPAVLFAGAPVALALWVARGSRSRRRVQAILVLFAAQALVLLPWEVWAYTKTGHILPVSSGSKLSVLDGLTIAIKSDRDGPWVPEGVRQLMWDVQDHRHLIDGPASASLFLLSRSAEKPVPVAQLAIIKAVRSWYGTDSLRFELHLAFLQIPYLLLAAVGLVLLRRRRQEFVWFLVLGITLYTWLMTCMVLSILRYMVPAMALLLLPAAIAAESTWRWLRQRRPRTIGEDSS